MKILNPNQLATIAAGSVPTPPSGYLVIFNDTDALKTKNSAGTVVVLSGVTYYSRFLGMGS